MWRVPQNAWGCQVDKGLPQGPTQDQGAHACETSGGLAKGASEAPEMQTLEMRVPAGQGLCLEAGPVVSAQGQGRSQQGLFPRQR